MHGASAPGSPRPRGGAGPHPHRRAAAGDGMMAGRVDSGAIMEMTIRSPLIAETTEPRRDMTAMPVGCKDFRAGKKAFAPGRCARDLRHGARPRPDHGRGAAIA